MDKKSFIEAIWEYAQEAADALGIPASWVAAHWAHETGYRINENFNLAGIWAYPGSPHGIAGKTYSDLGEFTQDYINTMSQPRYAAARNAAENVTEFARFLRLGGYATDSSYERAATWTEAVAIAESKGSGPAVGDGTELRQGPNPSAWDKFRDKWNSLLGKDTSIPDQDMYSPEGLDELIEARKKVGLDTDHLERLKESIKPEGTAGNLSLMQKGAKFIVIFGLIAVLFVVVLQSLPIPTPAVMLKGGKNG